MASSEPRPNIIALRKIEPKTSIQQAARDGREAEVRAWLNTVPGGKKRKLLNTKDKYGFTALHYAARFNRFKIMQLLLLDGADPKIRTNEGLTVLHYAARYVPVVHEESDMSSHQQPGGSDITPSSGNKQMMMLLIDHYKVNVNVADAYNLTPLHLACTRGNKKAVEVLLNSKKVNVNAKDKQLSTPLHAACRLEDAWFVEQLLSEGADAMVANDEGSTPLHIACLVGNNNAVKLILQKKFEERRQLLSATDNEQNTPLHLACEAGEVEILHVLFLNQADPEVFKLHGISPFHLAAKEGHTEVAEIMLEYGMSIDVKDDELQTPLHYAARFDQDHMIKFLLDKNANIEALDADSYTPLLTAVAYGRKNAMEILMEHGAAVDVIDRDQKSIVFIAAEENYADILRGLVSGSYHHCYGRLKWSTDSAGNTPLHIAATKGHLESVGILLRVKDIKISAHNGVGKTPMHLAAEMGHILVVQELAKFQQALLYDEDEDSNTPLHLACSNGHYSMAKVLLDAGCEPDQKNAKDWTPMDCAAHGGWDYLVKLLIEAEAELEPEDRGGVTPLHRACKQGHLKVVTLLMSRGAQVSHLNHDHMNGLDIAIESGHSNIALAIVESDQWKSALRNTASLANGRKTTPTRRLIYRMPDVATVVFNRCLTTNEETDHVTREDRNLQVTFNYEFLEDDRDPPPGLLARLFCCAKSSADRKSSADSEWGTLFDDDFSDNEDDRVDVTSSDQNRPTKNNWGPVGFTKSNHPVRIMVKKKQAELLSHPLVTSLLHYKWIRYGQLAYGTNLMLYLVYLILLTAFALLVPPPNSEICTSMMNFTNTTCSDNGLSVSRELAVFSIAIIVGFLAIMRLLLEVFEFFTLRIRYLFDWLNYLEVILYGSTIVFIFIFLEPCYCPRSWQWQIGAVVVFLAWIDLISRIRKLPLTGIYVLMFINIFYSFWKMAILSILLILSFSFSFYMLFNDPTITTGRFPFSDVGASIVKTMTMTTGEFEYDTIFRQCGEECPTELPYPIVSYVLWIFFLILMPILLTNLLVGLAVDDVKGIQQAAVLKRLELRVDHTLSVEELMPQALRRWVIITSYTVRPNRKLNILEKLWYNYLQFSRFDSIEKLNAVLDLPRTQAENARLQSKKLEQKIDSLEERLEYMTGLLKSIADKSSVEKTESTEMSIEDLTEI